MMDEPCAIFKCLADPTRLRTLLLIRAEGELCVCELGAALELSQPKVSRHLALLRNAKLLLDSRQGQWIFYRLNPELNDWIEQVLAAVAPACACQLEADLASLQAMGDRPERQSICC
ncbi:ArsR family transcriptional regulator [Motiliproteus coralliicola]|uniref:ArsR family transcriptional regulator n=2 Tax=Motiliproteus coralliicola TaxID=2283196 RepID=A0A369WCJ8_9GAMM|nr:ArsR family transcriptional regulator [Motiliproteus coralliicola]